MPSPGEAKPPWEERKAAYLDELGSAEPSVLRVSLADKLHNGRSLLEDLEAHGTAVWGRINAPPDRQAAYYGELLAAYKAGLPGSTHLPALREVVARIRDAAAQASAGAVQ